VVDDVARASTYLMYALPAPAAAASPPAVVVAAIVAAAASPVGAGVAAPRDTGLAGASPGPGPSRAAPATGTTARKQRSFR